MNSWNFRPLSWWEDAREKKRPLASVNFRGLPLFAQPHKVLDVRVIPVANAHCKPERNEREGMWVEICVYSDQGSRPHFQKPGPGSRRKSLASKATNCPCSVPLHIEQAHHAPLYIHTHFPSHFLTVVISHLFFPLMTNSFPRALNRK